MTRKIVIHNHLAKTRDDSPQALYNKVDSIGGRAFMAGGDVRKRVGRKVERVKSLIKSNPEQFKKEAYELISWAEGNSAIPGWLVNASN